jgi:sacsin
VKSFLNDPEYSFDYAFDTDIEYRSAGQIERSSFAIHHSIVPVSMNCDLREWAERQKLIPWVAVAVAKEDTETQGSLFSVLPLPIPTHQPVHVHGLFSISPDRGKLYQSDKRNQDQTPARWNDWLMQGPVPAAWVKLLIYLTRSSPRYASFQRWPQIIHAALGPLGDIAENLFRIIDKECLAIWPTVIGYVPVDRGLLATGAESAELREALREAKIPVVYVPPQLQERAAMLFEGRILCPQSLCSFLKYDKTQTQLWSDQTKHKTLEYLISKPGSIDYDGLELFPCRDGMYRSIGEGSVFVHRDEFEEGLFYLDDSRNLDLNKLSESAQSSLKRGCEDSTAHRSIRYRSADSLRDYCARYIFTDISTDQEMVELGEEAAEFVLKAWTWISTHPIDILDEAMSGLWLLPLSNGLYRSIRPRNPSQQVYFAPVGDIGELMWRFDSRLSTRPLPLLRAGPAGSTPGILEVVIGAPLRRLFISDASSTLSFLQWLRQTLPLLGEVEDEEKLTLVRLVALRLTGIHASERKEISEALRALTIFQKIAWSADGNNMWV